MIKHELIVAWRNFLKYKQQTVISILCLAVGLLCFAFCNSLMRERLGYNQRLPYIDETYFLSKVFNGDELYPLVDIRLAEALWHEFPEIGKWTRYINIGGYSTRHCVVEYENGQQTCQREFFICTDSTFLDFYDIHLLQGDWDRLKVQTDVVLLTPSAARRIFGRTDVVGRMFTDLYEFAGRSKKYVVAGLVEEFPPLTDFGNIGGILINPGDWMESPYSRNSDIRFRLKQGSSCEQLNQKLDFYMKQHPEWLDREGNPYRIYPYKAYDSGRIAANEAWIFSGMGGLVLLAALFNYVLFVSGRVLNRQKELGMRQITGAGTRNLFRLFAVEITLTVAGALILAWALAELLQNLLIRLDFDVIQLATSYQQRLIMVWLLEYALLVWGIMMVVVRIIVGRVRRKTMVTDLQGGGSIRYKSGVQTALLGLQLFICMMLTGAVWFLHAQQSYLQQRAGGSLSIEEKERIYGIPFNLEQLNTVRDNFRNLVASNPDITDICRCEGNLFTPGPFHPDYQIEGKEKRGIDFYELLVDANYPEFVNARIEEGRFFRENEPDGAVVNRAFARRYGEDILGKTIRLGGQEGIETYRIVGILEDILVIDENPVVVPCLYLPYGGYNLFWYVKLRPGATEKELEPLIREMKACVSPFTDLRIMNVNEDFINAVSELQETGWLVSVFAMVCMLISLLGIYSSMMLAVEKRSREMAIRKINGASWVDIARIFIGHYLWLLIGAAVIAFPLLWISLYHWLQNYEWHIRIGMLPFVGIFLLMGMIVGAAIFTQLLKIMRVKVVDVLKIEG